MKRLREHMEAIGLTLDDDALIRFEIYANFLVEYNKKVNLTAITELNEIIIKHFLDSIYLLNFINLKEGATVIDIGTGAGFPGLPLKIVRPDIRLTLLDSLNKRLIFLEELLGRLDIEAKLVHGRAEDVAQESPFRDGYDMVVSRAVTKMPALCEYCIPYAEVGGDFIAYKGSSWQEELEISKPAIARLGAKTKKIFSYQLPHESGERSFIIIEKQSETPDRYPRQGVNIIKKPILK